VPTPIPLIETDLSKKGAASFANNGQEIETINSKKIILFFIA
jgi:hypothetical protein